MMQELYRQRCCIMKYFFPTTKRGALDLEDYFFYLLFFIFIAISIVVLGLEGCSSSQQDMIEDTVEQKASDLSAEQEANVYLNTVVEAGVLEDEILGFDVTNTKSEKRYFEDRSFVFFSDWLLNVPSSNSDEGRGKKTNLLGNVAEHYFSKQYLYYVQDISSMTILTNVESCIKIENQRDIISSKPPSSLGGECDTTDFIFPISNENKKVRLGVGGIASQ